MMLHLCLQCWRLLMRNEESELLMYVFCVFSFRLYSPLRLSAMSVVFDFNASLNGVVPVSPILLPIEAKRKEKSDLLMDAFCVPSFFCLHNPDRVQ